MKFIIENNDIIIATNSGIQCGQLGTLLPYDNETFLHLIYRAYEHGKKAKLIEIQELLGISP